MPFRRLPRAAKEPWPPQAVLVPNTTVESVSMAHTPLLTPVRDLRWPKTRIMRITDASIMPPPSQGPAWNNFGPYYTSRQCWNADQTRMLLTVYSSAANGDLNPHYASTASHLFDGRTYQYIGPLVDGSSLSVGHHWRWSNTDPDELLVYHADPGNTVLKKFNLSTMAFTTVKNWSSTYIEVKPVVGGTSEPSRDGRYWAMSVQKTGGAWYIACWDRLTDTILCEIPTPVESAGDGSYLAHDMSRTGAYILTSSTQAWTSGATNLARGLAVWDKSGNLLREFDPTEGSLSVAVHNCLATDVEGNDRLVHYRDPTGFTNNRWVASYKLSDGTSRDENDVGMTPGLFYLTSTSYAVDGWVIHSDYPSNAGNSTYNLTPMRGHTFAIKLDGSKRMYPIFEERISLVDYTGGPYFMTPWSTSDRYMRRILFKSGMNTDWSGGVPADFHTYIAERA